MTETGQKTPAYYVEIEAKYGIHARRAAEAADAIAQEYENGEVDFGTALASAVGAAYRPGVVSGR